MCDSQYCQIFLQETRERESERDRERERVREIERERERKRERDKEKARDKKERNGIERQGATCTVNRKKGDTNTCKCTDIHTCTYLEA